MVPFMWSRDGYLDILVIFPGLEGYLSQAPKEAYLAGALQENRFH